jgi:hypothetical protein
VANGKSDHKKLSRGNKSIKWLMADRGVSNEGVLESFRWFPGQAKPFMTTWQRVNPILLADTASMKRQKLLEAVLSLAWAVGVPAPIQMT